MTNSITPEPFDPSPQTDHQVAENYLAQSCERLRKGYTVLENSDPERARRWFKLHQDLCRELEGMR